MAKQKTGRNQSSKSTASGRPSQTSAASKGNIKKTSVKAASGASKRKKKNAPATFFDLSDRYGTAARLFVIAMSIIFPLAIGSEKYANITHFKNVTYYAIAALSFGLMLVMMIIDVMGMPEDQFNLNGNRSKAFLRDCSIADIAVAAYWVCLLISTLLSDYKAVAIFGQGVRNDGMIIQTFYVVTYFVISRLVKLQRLDLNIYCLGGTLVSLLCITHFFGCDLLDTGFPQPNWISHLKFMGPMGNINLTSYFVTVTVILSAALYITEQHIKYDKDGRWLLLCFGVMLFAELNLNTDAGLVALGAAVMAGLPLLVISTKRLGRTLILLSAASGVIVLNQLVVSKMILGEGFGKLGTAAAVFGIICLAVGVVIKYGILKIEIPHRVLLISGLSLDGAAVLGGLVLAFIAAKTQTKGIVYELGQMLFHGNFDDRFGTNRLFTWKRTLKLSGRHFIFGSGPDTFCNVFQEAYGEESDEFFGGRNLDKAHNEYLQLLICSGFTSLAAFLTFIGGMVVDAYRRMTENPMLASCALAVVGYAVHAFFGYSLPINSPLMWVLFGLTGAAVRVKNECE